MSFPTNLSNAIDGVTEVVAAHLNNLEAKVGIDNSAVVTSLDYVLKNGGSIDPGHKHSKLWASDGSPESVTVDAAGVATFASIPLGPGSNPTTDNQLARKAYVDLMLPLAGGTMAGNIAMNNHKVTGLAAASGAGEALRYDEWIAAQDPGHKHSKLWASDGSPEAVTVDANGIVTMSTGANGTQLKFGPAPAYFSVYGNQITLSATADLSTVGGWTARATTACGIDLSPVGGQIFFWANSGLTAGNGFSPNNVMKIFPSGAVAIGADADAGTGNLYLAGDCSALTFTDRTPHFEGDALAAIKGIKGKNGGIDHQSLPEFAKRRLSLKNETGEIVKEEEGRDIGAMVSILTVAIQQMQVQIDTLQTKLN